MCSLRTILKSFSLALILALATNAYARPLQPWQGGTGCESPVAFGSAPSTPNDGSICTFSDGTGSACSGGSANTVCFYNGSAWTPFGDTLQSLSCADNECAVYDSGSSSWACDSCGSGGGGGDGDITDVFGCAADDCDDILAADGDTLDFGLVLPGAGGDGIILPQQAGACTAATAEGQICWDSTNHKLYVGNSSTPTEINGVESSGALAIKDSTSATVGTDVATLQFGSDFSLVASGSEVTISNAGNLGYYHIGQEIQLSDLPADVMRQDVDREMASVTCTPMPDCLPYITMNEPAAAGHGATKNYHDTNRTLMLSLRCNNCDMAGGTHYRAISGSVYAYGDSSTAWQPMAIDCTLSDIRALTSATGSGEEITVKLVYGASTVDCDLPEDTSPLASCVSTTTEDVPAGGVVHWQVSCSGTCSGGQNITASAICVGG